MISSCIAFFCQLLLQRLGLRALLLPMAAAATLAMHTGSQAQILGAIRSAANAQCLDTAYAAEQPLK